MSKATFPRIRAGFSFLGSLPSFLRHPVTVEEATETVRERIQKREDAFLHVVRNAIFRNPQSPYLQLMNHAGCNYGDIEHSVRTDGMEAALADLFRAGVYLTFDELKVHHEAVRGNEVVRVSAELLRNPLSETHLLRASGGSRSMTVVGVDLRDLRDVATNFQLFIAARGGMSWRHGIWTVPGATVYRILELAGMGLRDFVCFTQLDAGKLDTYYRWSERLMRWASLLAGFSLPRPELVSLDDPRLILRWMESVLRSGNVPHLWTSVSCAVRLCLAARESSVDLEGANFTVSGEPLTASRMEVFDRAGVRAVAGYGSTETAWIGNGCLSPCMPGEQHLFDDRVAVIQPGQDANRDMPPDALLVSSIRPSAPLVCLNLSVGDQAVLTTRTCGCNMEALGWTRHAHAIRSYEKLTTAGMSFLDHDLAEILERILPQGFGGSPIDYQVVEEEGGNGLSRLVLLVSPSVGPINEESMKKTFLDCLGTGSGRERVMADLIRDAKLLQIERRAPEMTRAGKILHLQASHKSGTSR